MPTTWTGSIHRTVAETGWPARFGISAAFAGFLMLMASISFPLPWTPVPFSMMPFALLVAGAYQRPGWAGLSVAIYLAAAALGAPVFADGESGFRHLIGATAGYLWGFIVVSMLVSWYMQERRRVMPTKWIAIIGGAIALLVLWGVLAVIRFQTSGGLAGYGESYATYGVGRSVLWVMLFLTVMTTVLALWSLRRLRGDGNQALNLFLVMMGAIGVLHFMGVSGLVLIAGMGFMDAVILGSIVFLPFDIIKAGLAVGLSLPFLPAPLGAEHSESSHA